MATGCTSSAGAPPESAQARETTDDPAATAASLGVTNLRPGGHFIHCKDSSSAQAEFLFAETRDDQYALVMREAAYNGQTLGMLLDTETLDPAFESTSHGDHLVLTAHIPVDAGTSVAPCTFGSSSSVLDCGLGSLLDVKLSDGAAEKRLDDIQLYVSTKDQTTKTASGTSREIGLHVTMYGPHHPFPAGYSTDTGFDPRSCTSR
jgi:hypothetical protein